MGQITVSRQQSFIGPPVRAKTNSRHNRRSYKAKRLVEIKQMSRKQQLQIRKQGIGSSDAATACGMNPHMSMLELWMIKTGRMQQSIEDESAGYAPLYWGKRLELLIAEYYNMHTNHKVRRVNAVLHILMKTNTLCWRIQIMLWQAMKKFSYLNAKRLGSMAPNCGGMAYRYMSCVKSSINWLSLARNPHF